MPPRGSDNVKRQLISEPDKNYIKNLRQNATYKGSPKHKLTPHVFGLEPFSGKRGDATLCDKHAGFSKNDVALIPQVMDRGLQAGLVGENGVIWAVADNGWIFEARITIPGQFEFHGYPVRASEAIAQRIYERFTEWAHNNGGQKACNAAANCKALYGFK